MSGTNLKVAEMVVRDREKMSYIFSLVFLIYYCKFTVSDISPNKAYRSPSNTSRPGCPFLGNIGDF